MRADTDVLEGLAAKVAELERRLDDVARLHEIIAGAGEPAYSTRHSGSVTEHKRRHLHLVTSPPAGASAGSPHAPGPPAGVSAGGKDPT
jgi:hypothetical protein